jgi:uncharacterized repeat protein (TIGR01451 family)
MLADILGAASTFAILAGSTVTSTNATAIEGDVGVSPGASITGFPPAVISDGAIHAGDADAAQARTDLETAYGDIAAETSNTDLTGQDLGGLILTPGVYHFDTSATLTGTLTLDAQGNPNARFDFQIGTTLVTAANSAVVIINDGQPDNVYFQLGTSATLDAGTAFQGNILADQSITLASTASLLDGRALALNAAVTLNGNQVVVPRPSSTVTTPVQTQADLSVTSTTAAGPVIAGDTIAYTVTLANAGPSDAQTVALSSLVPAGTTFVSNAQTSGPAFTLTDPAVDGTGTISATIGTLAAGASASFDIVVLVSPSEADGATISDTSDISAATTDPNLANNSQTVTTGVQTHVDVSVSNTAPAGPVLAGDTIAYSLTVANAGPSDARTVDLSDLVPANTNFVSDIQTSGPAFTLNDPTVGANGTVSDSIASLASGASAAFTIVVVVSPGAADGATITDTADLSTATADPNLANNSQTVTTSVQAQADLSVTNTTTAAAVLAGNSVTYTVTVANAGPSDALAVVLSDPLPADTTFVSETQTTGPVFTLIDPAVGAAGTISDTISTLPAGASATFTIVDQVLPSAADAATISNTANVSADTTDANLANNSQTVSLNAMTQADLSVTNTTTAVSVLAGNTIAYTVTVANAGPSNALDVLMSDVVPLSTSFISDTQISGPAFTLADPTAGGAGTTTDTIASLASGASATFSLVDRVSPSTLNGATITNTANVSSGVSDPDLANNRRAYSIDLGSTRPILTVASVMPPLTSASVRPTLSILGADTSSQGEAGLRYTWSVAHAPSGAKPVKFSVNGTQSAKDASVRVQKAGTYVFNCVITDNYGNSVATAVEVVIQQAATSLRLTPHAQIIAARASLQFGAIVLDQFKQPMPTMGDTLYAVRAIASSPADKS